MTWSRHGPPPGRRGYHHGNLREALIRATLDLIAERGLSGFTFAEAARAAGVSSAAPYRHYRDRQGLIADVAREGFERFGAELEKAWNGGRPTPLAAFENIGRAHLAFARNEPAYFSAMFEGGIAPQQKYQRLEPSFIKTLNSFRPMTRADAEGIRPNRIALYTARQGDTWQSIADHQGTGVVKATTLAIMNGHAVSDQPRPGERLKIVVAG